VSLPIRWLILILLTRHVKVFHYTIFLYHSIMRKSYRKRRQTRRQTRRHPRRRRTRGGNGTVLATPWKRDITNRPAPHAGVQTKGHIVESSRPKSSKMVSVGLPSLRGTHRAAGFINPKQMAHVAQSAAALQTLRNRKGTGLVARITRKLGRGLNKLKGTMRGSPARTYAFGPLASPR